MGASSSSCFYTAKAEASPSTEVDVVAVLEAVTMPSERTEYYSARCEMMMRSRGQFTDDVAMEIEFSKSHLSEVSRLEVAPQSAEEKRLDRENRRLLEQLREEYPSLFGINLASYVWGRMIARGGQAEIYEVVGSPNRLMKVFEKGISLRDLQGSCPLPVLNAKVRQCILFAGMLNDGRFVFLMERCWGDLRKLIDQAMLEKNVDGIQRPSFPYNGRKANRWNLHPLGFMFGIAWHMTKLHEKGVSHRDLKSSNILLQRDFRTWHSSFSKNVAEIFVADFECSIGVLETGFWRALEILATLGNATTFTNEQWKQADVYSYGMICFEIVMGRIPFDGELGITKADRQLVIEGKRPQLPSDLDNAVKDLITKCWEPNPILRPTFALIADTVHFIATREYPFRLFGIGVELPPQYDLATVQEVKNHKKALENAMPGWEIANLANGSVDGYSYGMKTSTAHVFGWEIANLANGSVDGYSYGMKTRLVQRSDVGYKLGRIHH